MDPVQHSQAQKGGRGGVGRRTKRSAHKSVLFQWVSN